MTECNNKEIGALLHAYELGLLNDDDARRVETHLLECPYCARQSLEMAETSRLLRNDRDIKTLIGDLDESDQPVSTPETTTVDIRPAKHRTLWRSLAVAAAVLIVLLLKPWQYRLEPDDTAIAVENRLAVAPFVNLSDPADSNRLAAVISNLTTTDLSESKYFQVIPSQNLHDIERLLTRGDLDSGGVNDPVVIARATRARWLLTGNIIQNDPNLVITGQIIDGATGAIVASHRITTEAGNIFAAVDRLAARVREDLLSPSGLIDTFDPSVADVTTHSAEAYRWYLEGVELYGKKHYDAAEDCYQRAVAADSTFAMGWYCLVYYNIPYALEKAVRYSVNAGQKERLYITSLKAQRDGDPAQARAILEELVQRYPDEKIAWMELASMSREASDYKAARKELEQSLKADPAYGDALNLLSYVYLDLGDTSAALTTVESYIALEPNEPAPYDTKGDILSGQGDLEEAIAAYEHAVTVDSAFVRYLSLTKLGKLYTFAGRYEDSRRCFRQIVTEGDVTSRVMARAYLPMISLHEGQLERALTESNDVITADRLEEASSVNSWGRLLKQLTKGRILEAMDKPLEAAAVIPTDIPATDPAFGICQVQRAYYYAQAGFEDSANAIISDLKAALARAGMNEQPLWRAQAMIAYAESDYSTAIDYATKLTDPKWHTFDSRYVVARSHLARGDTYEAAAELQEITSNYNDWGMFFSGAWASAAHFYLGQALERTGKPNSALVQYEQYVALMQNADPRPLLLDQAGERINALKQGL
ncbi:MAG TPA: tetratricopeptide repeat protein [candidate division Zixibacteria bacterium]|nr:tetratricopeptide repeat protein [candidate division Zixibacteria bacterium]